MPEWLGWVLGVLLLVYNVYVMCFRRFHFINVTLEVESHHSSLSLHVYPG